MSSRALRLTHYAEDRQYCPKVITLHYDDIIMINKNNRMNQHIHHINPN